MQFFCFVPVADILCGGGKVAAVRSRTDAVSLAISGGTRSGETTAVAAAAAPTPLRKRDPQTASLLLTEDCFASFPLSAFSLLQSVFAPVDGDFLRVAESGFIMVGNLLPADFDHDRVVRVCQRLPYFGTDIVEDHVLSGITDEQGMFSAVVQNNRPLFFPSGCGRKIKSFPSSSVLMM